MMYCGQTDDRGYVDTQYEDDEGIVHKVTFSYRYTYLPAYISGPPEDCYPEEEDFEYYDVKAEGMDIEDLPEDFFWNEFQITRM